MGSSLTRDEECCLVCGQTDYEDENQIGFCDQCGISVHSRCLGLSPEAFMGEFSCDLCKAFGPTKAMQVEC
jgi:hypothetical protein